MQRLPLRRDECARWRFVRRTLARLVAFVQMHDAAGAVAEFDLHVRTAGLRVGRKCLHGAVAAAQDGAAAGGSERHQKPDATHAR